MVSTTKPILTPAPPLDLCKAPVRLKEQELSQYEVEKNWSQDRANLLRCTKQRKIIEDYYSKRDKALME